MSIPILTTKLYISPPSPKAIVRPHLIKRLNDGLHRKLTLVSAPAGFGKTTIVSEWVANCERAVTWLSLDEGDHDPKRFLTYLVTALQTIEPEVGGGTLTMLQSPQPLIESVLISLLNEIATIHDKYILVLDDYHVLDAKPIDEILTFLLEHLPPQMHLVIATREDPQLPLARLRVRDQLTELRVTDLRFTHTETASFLNQMMGLNLSVEDIVALESRTEGWIAGLQLAAISLQGHDDTTDFVTSFTGTHTFVLDYLVEEVLQQQTEIVHNFLLSTSILERLCGSLCDAIVTDPSASGQEILEYIEHTNLFIVPLDNERRWYRYHHLFAELLRQRLYQSRTPSTGNMSINELHLRASQWYEDSGLEVEAFRHATCANDIERAERLIKGNGMPLYYRGAAAPILTWLESLPAIVLDAKPSLWVLFASVLSIEAHNAVDIEQKLQSAELVLTDTATDDKTRDLIGQIAAIRAMLAAPQYQLDTILLQAQRALEYLHPKNFPVRTVTTWTLGFAYQHQGDRVAAREAFIEAISMSEASGNIFINLLATTCLGIIQRSDNQLFRAIETFRRVIELVDEPKQPIACEAYLGVGRILYEWNDLEAAQERGEECVQSAQQILTADTIIEGNIFLARLHLAQGDIKSTSAMLARAGELAHQHNFENQLPNIATIQVLLLLQQGNLESASHLAQSHDLPLSQARVYLAHGDTSMALSVLETYRQQMEAIGWDDERLKVLILQAIGYHAIDETERAVQILSEALTLGQPGGYIRIFVDEGIPMAQLLSEVASRGILPEYTHKLLAVFDEGRHNFGNTSYLPSAQPLIEPLSERELEILQLIADGLSNRDISNKLYLALSTIKGHNRNIFSKLQVQRRTEAIARARKLGLL